MRDHHRAAPLPLLLLAALAAPLAAACSIGGIDVLGGRSKCWPESDPRLTSLMKGTVEIDAGGARLATPEGEVLALHAPPGGAVRSDLAPPAIVDSGGGTIVAAGERVTIFGGIGSDGSMVVCAIESRNEE